MSQFKSYLNFSTNHNKKNHKLLKKILKIL